MFIAHIGKSVIYKCSRKSMKWQWEKIHVQLYYPVNAFKMVQNLQNKANEVTLKYFSPTLVKKSESVFYVNLPGYLGHRAEVTT